MSREKKKNSTKKFKKIEKNHSRGKKTFIYLIEFEFEFTPS